MKTSLKRLSSGLFALTLSFTFITILLFWLATGTQAKANTVITVCASGCDYTTIAAAVTAAANGDTILIGPGTYTENITLTKVLTLHGADPATTIVDGNQNGSVFFLSNSAVITLTDLTITNGKANYYGGGVANNGQLLISHTVITHNLTPHFDWEGGGGIYNSGSLTVINSKVISNVSSTGAGVFNEGVAWFDHSVIGENRTLGGGMGVAVY